MRTLTAIALAVSMLVGVTAAQATSSTTTHKKKHHASSGHKGASDSKNSTKEKAPASK